MMADANVMEMLVTIRAEMATLRSDFMTELRSSVSSLRAEIMTEVQSTTNNFCTKKKGYGNVVDRQLTELESKNDELTPENVKLEG